MHDNLSPASFAQQRLWFLDQLDPENASYNLPRVIRLTGKVEVGALTAAIEGLVSRHDGIRTIFASSSDGEPRQSVLPTMPIHLAVNDLSHLPETERENAALRIARDEAKKPFDLTSGPLLRTSLIRLAQEEHILVLVMHHIITDGWSMSVFFRELATFYQASIDGRAPDVPELGVTYRDFTKWQSEYVSGGVLKQQIDYWQKKLQGADTILDLPTDRPRPATQSQNGATEHFFL